MLYKMSNISIGRVYIIICNVNPKIYYIGSTFNTLKHRWCSHKSKTTNTCNIGKYFEKYGIENFSIKLLKSYEVIREHKFDFTHLRAYEQLWINKLKGCCNTQSAFNPIFKAKAKQYREDNKEETSKKNKEKYEKNKEDIKAKNAEYYKGNKEKYSKYHKQRRIDKSEEIKEVKKKWSAQKIWCEVCQKEISRGGLNNHNKTKNHLKNLS